MATKRKRRAGTADDPAQSEVRVRARYGLLITGAQSTLPDMSGQQLIERFCETVDRGEVPSYEIVSELVHRLRKTIGPDGISADKALGLSRPAGRKERLGVQLGRAIEVERLKRAGMQHQEALSECAEKFHTSEKSIEGAYTKFRARAAKLLPVLDHVEAGLPQLAAEGLKSSGSTDRQQTAPEPSRKSSTRSPADDGPFSFEYPDHLP